MVHTPLKRHETDDLLRDIYESVHASEETSRAERVIATGYEVEVARGRVTAANAASMADPRRAVALAYIEKAAPEAIAEMARIRMQAESPAITDAARALANVAQGTTQAARSLLSRLTGGRK